MTAAKSVTATFVQTFDLTVTIDAPLFSSSSVSRSVTAGAVTSSCSVFGSDCVTYDSGEIVTLTANAQSGETFTGWQNASPDDSTFPGCSGTGTCAVTM
ncbi:MAG: hypothetical protein ACKOFX_09030, partial [Solirubrobacterales bacterium]